MLVVGHVGGDMGLIIGLLNTYLTEGTLPITAIDIKGAELQADVHALAEISGMNLLVRISCRLMG